MYIYKYIPSKYTPLYTMYIVWYNISTHTYIYIYTHSWYNCRNEKQRISHSITLYIHVYTYIRVFIYIYIKITWNPVCIYIYGYVAPKHQFHAQLCLRLQRSQHHPQLVQMLNCCQRTSEVVARKDLAPTTRWTMTRADFWMLLG